MRVDDTHTHTHTHTPCSAFQRGGRLTCGALDTSRMLLRPPETRPQPLCVCVCLCVCVFVCVCVNRPKARQWAKKDLCLLQKKHTKTNYKKTEEANTLILETTTKGDAYLDRCPIASRQQLLRSNLSAQLSASAPEGQPVN